MAMGEFRRTHSKVWWSHYPEEDEEEGAAPSPHWGPGLSLSGERRFSSSPSNGSHKSQDSGFSDSESSSPSGSTRSNSGSSIRQIKPLNEEDDTEVSETTPESESSEPEPKFVDPNLLLHIPLSRIPRVCLSHKSKTSDPDGSPKIAPNENIILDMNKTTELDSHDELARRYRKFDSYQNRPLSVSLEIQKSPYQLPARFNSIECLLNEQNLFSVSVSKSLDEKETRPPTPKPTRKSTCFIVDELPKKSFLQATLNSSDKPKCDQTNSTSTSNKCSVVTISRSQDVEDCVEPREVTECPPLERIPEESTIDSSTEGDSKVCSTEVKVHLGSSTRVCSTEDESNVCQTGNDVTDSGSTKVCSTEGSSTQVCSTEDSSTKISLTKVNLTESSPSKVCSTETDSTQVCSTEGSSTTISLPEATSTKATSTVRFLGNIDLAKSGDVERPDERNVSSNVTKDKTSKSCNLSWSPIRSESEADESDASPNKTVVFGYGVTVNELPGAPTHTSTPKGIQIQRARQSHRKIIGRKGLFQESQSNWDASVGQWLFELGTRYEPECMTTLQHKCLTSNVGQQVSVMAAASSQFVRDLQQRTKAIANEFSKLYRNVESESKEQLGPLVQSLVGHLSEFTLYIRKTLTESVFGFSTRDASDLSKISKACDRLKDATNQIPLNFSSFSSTLSYVGKLFSQFVDYLLKCQIKSLIHILEEPASDVTLLSALSGLTGMGLEPTHLASLVARCNGVRAILAICLDSQWTTVRVAALRTLATVCCSAQSIRQLEKARGVEVLADLLSDETKSEAELSEAASVLAQITAPWIEDNHKVEGLQDYINIFVTSLTRLVQKTKSSETLLLSSAALANLSFMEPKAVYALLEMGSAGYLLAAVRKLGARASVFLQEQAATMVANMAAVPETREHLAKHRAVVALLCFLQVRHSPLQRASEIAAAERLQHKSAIALSRLCSDPEVSQQVVELHGVGRLVRLCKEKRERNHSDAVLVACLAALRKITKNCGTTIMEEHDVSQLVEPRLLDSFLTYSSKQESYV